MGEREVLPAISADAFVWVGKVRPEERKGLILRLGYRSVDDRDQTAVVGVIVTGIDFQDTARFDDVLQQLSGRSGLVGTWAGERPLRIPLL